MKDNHLGGATITEAVGRARAQWPGRMIEVECDRLDQVDEAVAAGATVVLLDNMDPDAVREAVARVAAAGAAGAGRGVGRGDARLRPGPGRRRAPTCCRPGP